MKIEKLLRNLKVVNKKISEILKKIIKEADKNKKVENRNLLKINCLKSL